MSPFTLIGLWRSWECEAPWNGCERPLLCMNGYWDKRERQAMQHMHFATLHDLFQYSELGVSSFVISTVGPHCVNLRPVICTRFALFATLKTAFHCPTWNLGHFLEIGCTARGKTLALLGGRFFNFETACACMLIMYANTDKFDL